MLWGMFFGLVELLYYLCFLLLSGLAIFVLIRRPRSPLSRIYFLLTLTLTAWQVTLFLETRTAHLGAQLFLGRMNFAVVVLTAFLANRFVRAVARRGPVIRPHWFLLTETCLLFVLTLLTPLICAAERVEGVQAITTFGPLFALYMLHILGHLGAALITAFRARTLVRNPAARGQLTLIGWGILATSSVSVITNALLPFAFGNFRFCDVGPLCLLLFALAVAYAVFVHGLFDERLVLRKTLVYGMLLAFVLGAYSSGVFVTTQYLTAQADASKIVQFVVLLIAFSVDPLRRYLEGKTDHFLFGIQEPDRNEKKLSSRRPRHKDKGSILTLLFPWRH